MPKSVNIRLTGLEKHYDKWRETHPKAVPWEKLVHYIEDGDEFGRKVPVELLAELADTTKNTMLKWLPIYYEERPKK